MTDLFFVFEGTTEKKIMVTCHKMSDDNPYQSYQKSMATYIFNGQHYDVYVYVRLTNVSRKYALTIVSAYIERHLS